MTQLRTIKIYAPEELARIYDLAKLGFDMAYIATDLGISFTRFWIDYNNPALNVKRCYDDGAKKLERKNRKNIVKNAKSEVGSQRILNEEIQATKIRNKMNEIRALRENLDL